MPTTSDTQRTFTAWDSEDPYWPGYGTCEVCGQEGGLVRMCRLGEDDRAVVCTDADERIVCPGLIVG